MAKLESIKIQYMSSDQKTEPREAQIKLKEKDGLLQSIAITLPETDKSMAIGFAGQLIASILDSISFRRRVPLQIRHINIYQAETEDLLSRYLTLPYSTTDLEEEDIRVAFTIANRLTPYLRLFREALNSTKPHYRLLCLYRVKEGLITNLQQTNNEALKSQKIAPKRPIRKIPDNELTRKYFPDLIDKKFGAFLEYVRIHYRIPIAHLTFDEYERMLMDPADVRNDHRIDYTNAVLISVIGQMIEDEWNLMRTHNLV